LKGLEGSPHERIGLDFRLDQTHQIEYTHEEFFEELQNAGWNLKIMRKMGRDMGNCKTCENSR